MNGVIETSSGDLLRASTGPVVAGEGETERNDVPQPPKIRYAGPSHHRWDGLDWVEVSTPAIKIYDYLPFGSSAPAHILRPPLGLDFRRGLNQSLHEYEPLSRGDRGNPPTRYFYANFDDGTGVYSDPVVKIETVWTDDEINKILQEDRTIHWYRVDESTHPETKLCKHRYSGDDRNNRLRKRRDRIMEFVQDRALVWMLDTMDAPPWSLTDSQIEAEHNSFFTYYSDLIDGYVATYDLAVNTDPTDGWNSKIYNETGVNSGNSWLDNTIPGSSPPETIRQAITDEIDYG